MADYQTISVGFGPGLDSKTDPKASSKPIQLTDCIFTKTRQIKKRNGYDALTLSILTGGTISNPVMVKSYKNELVCAGVSPTTGNRLFSYSSALGVWSDKGKYNSIEVSKKIIAAPELNWISASDPAQVIGTTNSSGTFLNNVILYGYDQGSTGPNQTAQEAVSVYWAAYDNETGTRLAGSTITSAYGFTWGFSKVVTLGSSRFAIFYISDTSNVTPTAPMLCFKTITITAGGVTLGAEVQVHSVLYTPDLFYIYDVVSTPGGCFVAVYAPNGGLNHQIFLATYDATGSLTHSTGQTTGAQVASVVNVVLDQTSTNAWIYWIQNTSVLKYAIYDASTLALVLTSTSAQTGLSGVVQVTALPTSATTQTNYVSTRTNPASTFTIGIFYPAITQQALTSSGGLGSVLPFIKGVEIYAKPFYCAGIGYLPCVSLSQALSTGFILDVNDFTAAAKFLQTEAEGVYETTGDTSSSAEVDPIIISSRTYSFLNPIISFSATDFGLPCGFVVSLDTFVPLLSGDQSAAPSVVTANAQMGVCLISFDFDNIDAFQGIVQQDLLCLNGGIVSNYDGSSVTEVGYNIDPDGVSVIWNASVGGMGAGLFTYYILEKWTDSNGNLNQSAPSIGVSIKFTARSNNSVSIGWAPLNLTQKFDVTTEIYRTLANGVIPYLVAAVQNSAYGWGNTNAAFVDTTSDAQIQDNPVLYTEGGAILENIAPPPSMILWTNNNRLWAVDSENPETTLEYSKTASNGSGISFSTGFLEYIIDSKGGSISGASPMDEKTIILKQSAVGYFVGDGSNDAGSGSTLSNFQFIPSDVGCTNSKSVILYPGGIIFKSLKGIYQVSRGVQISYFGYEVERYNAQDIQSALIVSSLNQIRFLTSNGSSLLYDYAMNQWDVFTNHAGLSADSFNGLYVYARSANNSQDNSILYIEDLNSFLDNVTPIIPSIQIQFVKAQSIQNFERLRRVMLLGDYQSGASSGHGVQISASYDFGTTFSVPVPYYFNTPTPYQYRERLPRQKCDSVSLLIQEITTGAAGEYIDFTDLGFELAAKKGLNKLPGSRSVG